jgi:hypothetical protein
MPEIVARDLHLPIALSRRVLLGAAMGTVRGVRGHAVVRAQADDPLPAWNDGAAKEAILDFVAAATDDSGAGFVPVAERIATFDQDGTLWVEQPIYTEAVFALDRIKVLAANNPDWATKEPFATVLSDNQEAIASFDEQDWAQIIGVSHAGMTVEGYLATAAAWLATARHPHFDRLYTDLIYQPVLEVMALLRREGFRTYIVSGGGQDFIEIAKYPTKQSLIVGGPYYEIPAENRPG